MTDILPPDPAGGLKIGPAADWKPNRFELRKMEAWSKWMTMAGLPEHKAKAWAFELWKMGRQVDTGSL